jgi:hypothetical protein
MENIVVVTLQSIVDDIKASDQRFRENISLEAINHNIRMAFIELATKTMSFYTSETIPVKELLNDMLDTVYVNPSYEIIDYYDIYFENIKTREKIKEHFSIELDKSIYFKAHQLRNKNNLALVLKYYYIPILEDETTVNIEPEIYVILLELVLGLMWKYYKDYDKYAKHEQIAQEKLLGRAYPNVPKDSPVIPLFGGLI